MGRTSKYNFLMFIFVLFIMLALVDVSLAGNYGSGPFGRGSYGIGYVAATTPTAGGGTTSVSQGGYASIDVSKGIVRAMSIKDASVVSLGEFGGGSGGGSTSHQIVLDKLTSDSVTLKIYSEPIEIVLKVGESKKVDIDGDNILDILIELRSIDVPHKKADIYFEDITPKKEAVPSEEVEEKPGILTGAVQKESPEVPKEKPSKAGLCVLIIILVMITIIGYWFIKNKKIS